MVNRLNGIVATGLNGIVVTNSIVQPDSMVEWQPDSMV